jgi:hypothetical protein
MVFLLGNGGRVSIPREGVRVANGKGEGRGEKG